MFAVDRHRAVSEEPRPFSQPPQHVPDQHHQALPVEDFHEADASRFNAAIENSIAAWAVSAETESGGAFWAGDHSHVHSLQQGHPTKNSSLELVVCVSVAGKIHTGT